MSCPGGEGVEEAGEERRKSHRTLIPAAMAHQMVRANQNIVEEAAIGDREA